MACGSQMVWSNLKKTLNTTQKNNFSTSAPPFFVSVDMNKELCYVWQSSFERRLRELRPVQTVTAFRLLLV